MKLFTVALRENNGLPQPVPTFYADEASAIGWALMQLDRKMREAGLEGKYKLFPPFLAGDGALNLSAYADNDQGYPRRMFADAYVLPVEIHKDLEDDFMPKKEASA